MPRIIAGLKRAPFPLRYRFDLHRSNRAFHRGYRKRLEKEAGMTIPRPGREFTNYFFLGSQPIYTDNIYNKTRHLLDDTKPRRGRSR